MDSKKSSLASINIETLGEEWSLCDIATDVGYRATFCQIVNYGDSDVRVRLNGSRRAVFTLASGEQKTFDKLVISSVGFMHNNDSGNDDVIPVEVIFGY